LSAKDRELLQSVPVVSAQILGPVPALSGVAKIVRHAQERWDGAGTPDRLAGEEIPAGSRILAVVDALEHLLAELRKPKFASVKIELMMLSMRARLQSLKGFYRVVGLLLSSLLFCYVRKSTSSRVINV
jgi:response regulator RpfG family c-di-GMP phosphodiesterase